LIGIAIAAIEVSIMIVTIIAVVFAILLEFCIFFSPTIICGAREKPRRK